MYSAGRCRHAAIATYFGDAQPSCDRSCDYCRDAAGVERDWEQVQEGVEGGRRRGGWGRTAITDPDDDLHASACLYGGGRLAVKL